MGFTKWVYLAAVTCALSPAAGGSEGESEMSHMDGYAIGRALSGYYTEDEKEGFVTGLLLGLREAADTTSLDIASTKGAWFANPALSERERASYAAGYLNGETYSSPDLPYSAHAYVQGLMDRLQSRGPGFIDLESASRIVADYQRKEFFKLKRQVGEQIQANVRAGKRFLDANALEPEVVSTASGLQYRVVREGDGDSPSLDDSVVVNLVGRKIDGRIFFDSRTEGDGKPVTVKVRQTLKGWQEALVEMSPGATWEIFMPSTLAYGNAGWQNIVDPGEALIYRIELVGVERIETEASHSPKS